MFLALAAVLALSAHADEPEVDAAAASLAHSSEAIDRIGEIQSDTEDAQVETLRRTWPCPGPWPCDATQRGTFHCMGPTDICMIVYQNILVADTRDWGVVGLNRVVQRHASMGEWDFSRVRLVVDRKLCDAKTYTDAQAEDRARMDDATFRLALVESVQACTTPDASFDEVVESASTN